MTNPQAIELDKEVFFTLDTIVKPATGSYYLPKGSYILRLQIAGANIKRKYCYLKIDLNDEDPKNGKGAEAWGYYITAQMLESKKAERILGNTEES